MDAPPPGEDVKPFIDVAERIRSAGLHAPEIYHADTDNGFLLLEDLGDDLYRDILSSTSENHQLAPLFDVLKEMALKVECTHLGKYNPVSLRAELDLFPDWYLGHHRSACPRAPFDAIWDDFCQTIINNNLQQAQCFVHRDFHSSNLLKTKQGTVAIIDFQDAVKGPISYDLISMIWDRYITWPRAQIENWCEAFRQSLQLDISAQDWQRDCDWMGLQRNFKIVGIFARLYHRDGKAGYIEMIPRFYQYLTDTLRRYPEFRKLLMQLEQDQCVP